jgi:hypothetical protein
MLTSKLNKNSSSGRPKRLGGERSKGISGGRMNKGNGIDFL